MKQPKTLPIDQNAPLAVGLQRGVGQSDQSTPRTDRVLEQIAMLEPDACRMTPLIDLARRLEVEMNKAWQSNADWHGEVRRLRAAIRETLEENAHLADGDVCTLIKLKRAAALPND